jgi:hypothetical protein
MYRWGGKFEWFDRDGKLASSGSVERGFLEDL